MYCDSCVAVTPPHGVFAQTVQVLVKDAMSIGMAVSVVPVVQLPNAAGVQCGVYFLL